MIDPYDDDLDQIAEFDITEPAPVDDTDQADKYMRWLRRTRNEITNIRDVFDAEIGKLTARRDDLLAGPTRRAEQLEDTLRAWAVAQRELSGTKSVNLVHGTVSTRAGRQRVAVDDELALIEWAELNDAPIVKRSVSKTDVQTLVQSGRFAVTDNGVVDGVSGEIVPGVRVVTGDVTASVKPL